MAGMGDGIVLFDQAQCEAQAMRHGERLYRAWQSLIAQSQPDPDAVDEYLGWVGSHERLAPILTLWRNGALPQPTLNRILAEWWSSAGYPSETTTRTIVRVVAEAGFVTDRAGVERPAAPLTVYRGGSLFPPRGVCWTTDPVIARFFAYRFGTVGRAVFTAMVPPHGVLGLFFERNESEVLVNPLSLRKLCAEREEG